MDILRQNKIFRYLRDPNSMTTTVTNGLQQFYMITLSYFPRQFGGRGGRVECRWDHPTVAAKIEISEKVVTGMVAAVAMNEPARIVKSAKITHFSENRN